MASSVKRRSGGSTRAALVLALLAVACDAGGAGRGAADATRGDTFYTERREDCDAP